MSNLIFIPAVCPTIKFFIMSICFGVEGGGGIWQGLRFSIVMIYIFNWGPRNILNAKFLFPGTSFPSVYFSRQFRIFCAKYKTPSTRNFLFRSFYYNFGLFYILVVLSSSSSFYSKCINLNGLIGLIGVFMLLYHWCDN